MSKKPTPDSKQISPPPRKNLTWTRMWPYLALAALTLGIYCNSLPNGFVADDFFPLYDDAHAMSWRAIPNLFLHDVAKEFDLGAGTNYYRPVQFLVSVLLYHLAGRDPFSTHLIAILVHLVNTLLIFHLGKRWLASQAPALVAAALFAAHPIHVEVVAWAAALPDGLITLFILIALVIFVRNQGKPSGPQIAAISGLYLAALMSKETGVMLLPLVAGYEWLALGRSPRKIWNNRNLYFSLLAVFTGYLALRVYALKGLAPGQGASRHLSPMEFAFSAIAILGQYMGKLVAPLKLSYLHPFEPTRSVTLVLIVCLLAVTCWIAGIFVLRTKTPLMSYWLFWILVPLVPALNITGIIGGSVFNERYAYLSSAGIVWIGGLGWFWLAKREKQVAWILAGVIIAAYSYRVIVRNLDWRDEISLFTATLRGFPDDGSLHHRLGTAYQGRGDNLSAISEYRVAMRLGIDDASIHSNLGGALAFTGNVPEALAECRRAVEMDPNLAESYVNLGNILEMAGQLPEAEAAQRKALALRPNYAYALTALALLRRKAGDDAEAITLLKQAVVAKPGYVNALFNLGVIYSEKYQFPEALEAFESALATAGPSPYLYLIHYGIGNCYYNMGSPSAAAVEFNKTLQLKPDYQRAKQALDSIRGGAKQ